MKQLLILGCIGVSLVMTGCATSEHDDLKEWMKEQAKGMRGKVQPLPEITAFPAVAYTGEQLTPPFSGTKILTTDATNDKSAPDRVLPPQSPLQFPRPYSPRTRRRLLHS